MVPVPELIANYHILSRRIASLPSELDAWIEWATVGNTLEKNFPQIEVLDHFMRRLCKLNEDSLNALDPGGDVNVFLGSALDLSDSLVKSHIIWDFFRDRLGLRFVPQFQQSLLMADLVSCDCYKTVMDRAKALRILPQHGFREYPLIGLAAEFFPATWPRGQRPPALQNHRLPIPVIDLPWDHLASPWELLTIAHEVGHDVDEDLGRLTRALLPAVAGQLSQAKTPLERIVQWQTWTSEILADLVGILLTGPAFAGVLAALLTWPTDQVRHISSVDEHPPPYLRVFINTALVRRLGLSQSADTLEASWKALYGEPGDDFSSYLPEVEPVISAILDTPLDALRDRDGRRHSLSALIAFTHDDQARVEKAAARLAAGALPDHLPIRHVVSASQVAFERMAEAAHAAGLEMLARSTRQAIVDLSPPVQLDAGLASRRVRQHLDGLARAFLELPLDDFGIHYPTAKESR